MRSLEDALVPPILKRCSRCGEEKSIFDFYTRTDRDGRAVAQCKACDALRAKAANTLRRTDGDWVSRSSAARRVQNMRHKYGVTYEQLAELDAVSRCQACGRTAEQVGGSGRSGQRLHVDHDHATGAIRGILCRPCNSALGMAQDSPARLRALADYLEGRHAIAC